MDNEISFSSSSGNLPSDVKDLVTLALGLNTAGEKFRLGHDSSALPLQRDKL